MCKDTWKVAGRKRYKWQTV